MFCCVLDQTHHWNGNDIFYCVFLYGPESVNLDTWAFLIEEKENPKGLWSYKEGQDVSISIHIYPCVYIYMYAYTHILCM